MDLPPPSKTDLILNDDGSVYHLNLLPKHICDTIITVGDPGRVNQVTQYFDDIEVEINKREFVTITGWYKKKRITVISTGIGPDNIEIFFNEIDALVNYNLKTRELKSRRKKLNIIRLGTSGAIQNDIPVGTFLLSEYAIGLDNVVKFYPLKHSDYELSIMESLKKEVKLPTEAYVVKANEGLFNSFNKHFFTGNTVTCPGFYAPQGRSLRIPTLYPQLLNEMTYFHKDQFWLSNLEMETAAYYAFARMMDHNALSISAILANRHKETFSKNPVKVVDSLIKKTLELIYKSDL